MTHRIAKRTLAALVAVAAALAVVLPAEAQEDAPLAPTQVRAVNSRNPAEPTLQLLTTADPAGLTMTQSGEEVDVGEIGPVNLTNIVTVVDTGADMEKTGGLAAAKEGLQELNAALREDDRLGIVVAGEAPEVVSDPSRSRNSLGDAIGAIGPDPGGESALWASVRAATDLVSAEGSGQANVLVLTTNTNVSDVESAAAAADVAVSAGVGMFVVGIGQDFEAGELDTLVDRTGGALNKVSVTDTAGTVAEVGSLLTDQQYTVSFTPVVTEANEIAETSLTVGDSTLDFAYVTGTFASGASDLVPFETSSPSGVAALPFLSGSTGQLVLAVLALAAVAGIVYSLGLIFGRDESALTNVLLPYSEGAGSDDSDDEETSSLARTALLQRAVSLTEQVAESQGYLSRTESALERADLPLRAAEALFFYLCVVALTTVVGLVLLPPMGALIFVLAAALVPPAAVSFVAGRRKSSFQNQLPDMLSLLAGTLRAGYSLMQGVEAVSQEVTEPMGKELRRVVTEARLGRPLEESLDGVAERMASADFAWAVMAIRIQREVGGNLSELLLTVAETMVQRERLRRDINSLTAEGRMSAIVLVLLPIGLGAFMYIANPEYMDSLFTTTLGNILLALAIVAMGVGMAWMRSIIKIEV